MSYHNGSGAAGGYQQQAAYGQQQQYSQQQYQQGAQGQGYEYGAGGYQQQQQQPQQQQPQQQQQQQQVAHTPPPPPADAEVKERIDKFCNYLLRNGPGFEAMLREKQQQNPEFAFLFGGADHNYYRWRLWCLQSGWTDEHCKQQLDYYHGAQAQAQPAAAAATAGAAARVPMTPQLEREFVELLGTINGSKDSIKAGRRWIVKNSVGNEARIAEMVKERMESFAGGPHAPMLFLVYLLNDILHAFLKKREDKTVIDPFSNALATHLHSILYSAYKGYQPEDQEKVIKVVELWGTREFYPASSIIEFKEKLQSGAVPPGYGSRAPPPPVKVAAVAAAPAPPAAAGYVGHAAYPPAHAPIPPPTSLLHLGPGFVVTLCKKFCTSPYQPLDPMKVPHHMPPEYDKQPDAYMLSRLESFNQDVRRFLNPSSSDRRKRRRSRSRSRSSSRSSSRSRSRSSSRSRSRSRSRSPRRSRRRSRSKSPPQRGAAIPPPPQMNMQARPFGR